MQCEAVFGRSSIAFASFDAEIKLEIQTMSDSGTLSIAIFRYEDRLHFTYGTCTNIAVKIAVCEQQDLGKFIITKDDHSPYNGPVLNNGYIWSKNNSLVAIALPPTKIFNYTAPDSGVYCVYIVADGDQLPDFEAKMSV
jgi:hypothetical protein